MEPVGQHDAIGAARSTLTAGHGALAVVGSPGSGVSTVLDAIATQAAAEFDRIVLRASGRPTERDTPLAVLRELAAHDVDGDLARALTEAAADGHTEAVFEWARSTLGTAIVIDDIHDADTTSCHAITHLARRASLTRVVVVIGGHGTDDLDGITTVELTPLSVDELVAVLDRTVSPIDAAVAREIARLADGSPLVAVEVARSLDDAQRLGTEPLPSFAVVAAPIRHAFAHPFANLPDDTRRALCVAAAEPTGELRVIAAAIHTLGDDVSALDAAEAAGLIEIGDGEARFDHPIRRSVAYHQLAPASRRAAHRALAAALDAPTEAERRAAHLAAGVITPDERVAADLEFVAEAAERRRDMVEARRWWTAAARVSPDSGEAHRRRRRAEAAVTGDADPLAGLTKAERRVAAVVGSGATNRAAAETLFVSVKTVDAHLQSIYRKLGISSRAELAVLVTHAGLAGAPSTG